MGRSVSLLRRVLREFACTVSDLLIPGRCAGCGNLSGGALCGPCSRRLERIPDPRCPRCGEPLLGPRCPSDHRAVRLIAHARAAFRYRGTGGALVRRLKLSGDFAAGRVLVSAMAAEVRALGPRWRPAVLVGVPLHRTRRRIRGFDQADWLAAEIGCALGMRVESGALRRVRATIPQGDPRTRSRDRNVEGAFVPVRCGSLVGRRVVLIDDVWTSGATARQCARELLRAGARKVAAVTACRS